MQSIDFEELIRNKFARMERAEFADSIGGAVDAEIARRLAQQQRAMSLRPWLIGMAVISGSLIVSLSGFDWMVLLSPLVDAVPDWRTTADSLSGELAFDLNYAAALIPLTLVALLVVALEADT